MLDILHQFVAFKLHFSRQWTHKLSLIPWSYSMLLYSASTLITSHGLQ